MKIVRCDDIKKYFPIRRGYLKETVGEVRAVDGVSFEINRGDSFGLVGESGCGKTTLGKIVLGILKPDSGTVDLATDRAQVIFQDPQNSLDPKMRVRDILSEALILSGSANYPKLNFRRKLNFEEIDNALDLVKLPRTALGKYPHQFSGGERQRIAIARAVLTKPEFIVCDEPVSSLDVTVQLQILNLLKEIQKEKSVTYLFISHDLRVIKYMCPQLAVMKDGRIVEKGVTDLIYSNPKHPYTGKLLSSALDAYLSL